MRHFPTSPDPGGLSQGRDYMEEKLKMKGIFYYEKSKGVKSKKRVS